MSSELSPEALAHLEVMVRTHAAAKAGDWAEARRVCRAAGRLDLYRANRRMPVLLRLTGPARRFAPGATRGWPKKWS